jgi:type III restriction enzyme
MMLREGWDVKNVTVELEEVHRVKLRLEFATTETEIHQAEIGAGELPPSQELVGSITNKVISRAKLPNRFAELYRMKEIASKWCINQNHSY